MSFKVLIDSINDGFGGTLGKIGLVIVLGVIIGEFLEKSGGAFAMAKRVISVIGKKSVAAAMGIIGYIVSIPVFADSGFIILTPLNRSLTKRAGLSFATTSVALALGLMCTHTMVPPTPGPIAAAGVLGANLGLVLIIGIPVSLVTMFVCLLYTKRFVSTTYIDPEPELTEADIQKVMNDAPGPLKSALPIFIPILLIVIKSFIEFDKNGIATSQVGSIFIFIGEPVIALIIGFFLALLLPKKLKKEDLSSTGWVGKALKDAAIIILITGAGGAFGKILQNSGIADALSVALSKWPLGLWLPFIISAAIKSAQGSSTVALITTASIISPLMGELGFESEISKAMVVVAIGAGSAVVSHVNDSMFWIFTQITRMDVRVGLKKYTPGSLLVGLTAIILLNIIYLFVK
jgi:GntP family gluconate:H+ symporter